MSLTWKIVWKIAELFENNVSWCPAVEALKVYHLQNRMNWRNPCASGTVWMSVVSNNLPSLKGMLVPMASLNDSEMPNFCELARTFVPSENDS